MFRLPNCHSACPNKKKNLQNISSPFLLPPPPHTHLYLIGFYILPFNLNSLTVNKGGNWSYSLEHDFFSSVVGQPTCPKLSHASLTFVHACRIKLSREFNQRKVMMPRGGLGWLSRDFENAEK